MKVIQATNVNVAYAKGLQLLHACGVANQSRAGTVLVAPWPVTTVYERPMERVLFDPIRDANPFFHLMESLWMLAGRNDATWLDQFVKDFSKRFSEDGTQHGAYGFRWRSHFWGDDLNASPLDQLQIVIDKLTKDPNDRRVVIQMWDPEFDLCADKKDIPCNLSVLPRIVDSKLDITVTCRSNDAIWGAYGANAVHFSVLQEYLAAMLDVEVGTYYQISNNFHAYTNVFDTKAHTGLLTSPPLDPYRPQIEFTKVTPIVTKPTFFDHDLLQFFSRELPPGSIYYNEFFDGVAVPMFYSYRAWRTGKLQEAVELIESMPAGDWKTACHYWYARRLQKQQTLKAGE